MVGELPAPVSNQLPIGDDGILPVHLVPQRLLQIQLNKLDMIAARRVEREEPAPGPFGAATMVYNTRTAQNIIIGDRWDSNRVNADGPQAHAEAVNVYPDRYEELKTFLALERNDPDWVVVFLSTGESCPSCFTKQHIIVNDLIQSELIERRRVLNFYGADYDMTQDVAGFSDKDQLIDMQQYPQGSADGKVRFDKVLLDALPRDAQRVISESEIPVAVLLHNGQVFATGYDTRQQDNDLLATPEMNVVKAAALKKREGELGEAWNLSDMQLVSATDISQAPLARTAMFWASIGQGKILRNTLFDQSRYQGWQTIEAPGMSNAQLYAAATDRPYNGSNSLIHAFQAPKSGPMRFRNLAQHAWGPRVERDAKKGQNIHYDGGTKGGGHSGPACC